MKTLTINQKNELGAVPIATIISAGSSLVSSIFGSSSAKKVASIQENIARIQANSVALQANFEQSRMANELARQEAAQKSKTQTYLIVGGVILLAVGTGAVVFLSSRKKKSKASK